MIDLNLTEGFQELNTEELASVDGGSWARMFQLKSTIFSNMSTIAAENTPPNEPNAERVSYATQNIAGAITEMRGLFRGRWNSRTW